MLFAAQATTAATQQQQQQPAFGSVRKAEEAMASLLGAARAHTSELEAAARSVDAAAAGGSARDDAGGALLDAQMRVLVPVVARLLEPTIRRHFTWRDEDKDVPAAEVRQHNFLAFMLAFDAHAAESAAVAEGLRTFHTMLSAKAVAATAAPAAPAGHPGDEL